MSRFEERFKTYAKPQQNREHGFDVTFRRGNLVSATIIARKYFERRHEELGQEVGLSVKTEHQSWLVPVASFIINGETVVPQAGDQILYGSEVWVIHHPDNSTPAAELYGEYDWRVHTRLQGA